MQPTRAARVDKIERRERGGLRTFVARQPIFSRRMRVFGYELLFRTGWHNAFDGVDVDHASRKVIADSLLLLDLRGLAGGRPAFVNVTQEVLLSDLVRVIPPELAVIEILEYVEPTDEVVAACHELRKMGYRLALDDFVDSEKMAPLVEVAEFLKIDLLATPPDELERLARVYRNSPKRLLAEKVETREVLEQTARLGFELFQGYFFNEPVIVTSGDVPGHQQLMMRVLGEIHRPDLDRDELERLIKRDVGLSYKLLRYVNAAHLGLRDKIDSIRRALILLGEREIRRWSTLVVMTTIGQGQPPELLQQALVRARFSEGLAPHFGLESRADDLFLTGLFSVLDSLLGRPIGEILKPLPLHPDIRRALDLRDGALGPIYDYLLNYERCGWDRLASLDTGPDEEEATHLYLDAIAWGTSCLRVGLGDEG